MPKTLRAAQATPGAITQTIDELGNITAYDITVLIRYIDDEGADVLTHQEVVNAWPFLPQARRDQLQAIQDMIVAGVAARYLD
jgi:hypothetical protein